MTRSSHRDSPRPPAPALPQHRVPAVAEQVAAAVARGAAALDRRRPLWAVDVDVRTLEVMSLRHCVLTQLWGRYSAGLAELGLAVADEEGAADLGFTVATRQLLPTQSAPGAPGLVLGDLARLLTSAWRAEVARRVAWSHRGGVLQPSLLSHGRPT